MRYTKAEAKAHAQATMTGIWAAALMPFDDQLRIDEDGFRENVRHWTQDLGIQGLFISGKQGEFYAMTLEERKRSFELAVEATGTHAQTIMSCSDQNMDVAIELARHAEMCGADYIVVHAPFSTSPRSRMRRCCATTARSPLPSTSALPCGATPTAAI